MGRMSLSIYIKGDYEEFHALRRRKNKANFGILRAQEISGRTLSAQIRYFFMVLFAGKVILLFM